jgi:hypothetical protein
MFGIVTSCDLHLQNSSAGDDLGSGDTQDYLIREVRGGASPPVGSATILRGADG